jgi:hypothetical protein
MALLLKKKDEPAVEATVIEFELVRKLNGDLIVSEVENGWEVLGLRVSEGQVTFFRNSGIEDENFLTDEDGRLEEVDE